MNVQELYLSRYDLLLWDRAVDYWRRFRAAQDLPPGLSNDGEHYNYARGDYDVASGQWVRSQGFRVWGPHEVAEGH